jgi:HTH-type transcriptional regulator/antitoxin HigA
MEIHIIKNEDDYNNALSAIDKLLGAPENSILSERLEILSILVEDYENKYYQIDMPDPIEAIKARQEELGISRKDLEPIIGSRGRISEIFSRKRNLTLPMIRKLHNLLNIPASILINPTAN